MTLVKTQYVELDGIVYAYELDMVDVARYCGNDNPHGRFYNDELARYVQGNEVAPLENAVIPAAAYTNLGLSPYPQIMRTYSGTKAAEILGLSRHGFDYSIKKYPLVPDVVHNGVFGWTEERLIEWHKQVPSPGPVEGAKKQGKVARND